MVLKKRKIKKIFELKRTGLSIRKIAKKLGISPTTVFSYLKQGYSKEKEVSRKTTSVISREKKVFENEEILDETELLDKIIYEVTKNPIRPAIIRYVRKHIGDKKQSIKLLAEALDIAKFSISDKTLILRNWAESKGVKDYKKYISSMEGEKNRLSDEKEESSLEQLHNRIIIRKIKYLERQELSRQLEFLIKCSNR
jgi:IS30 family transposase